MVDMAGLEGVHSTETMPVVPSLSGPTVLVTVYNRFKSTRSLLCVYNNCRAYFVAVALSGFFAVTFSMVFAYVADCTSENERGYSYGLVSIT